MADDFAKNLVSHVFSKEKIAFAQKINKEYLTPVKEEIGLEGDDYIKDLVTIQFSSYLLSRKSPAQRVDVFAPRASFFDWLLRRRRIHVLEVNVAEIIRFPPVLPDDVGSIVYHMKEVDPEDDEKEMY